MEATISSLLTPIEVRHACLDALCNLGMKKKYGKAWKTIAKDIDYVVGLNIQKGQEGFRVHPNMSLYWIPLEKLMVEFYNEKSQNLGSTYTVPLGVSCPDIPLFVFSNPDDLLLEGDRLAAAVQDFGMPYMAQYADPEKLLPKIFARTAGLGGMQHRYPIGLFLTGRLDAAKEFCLRHQLEFSESGDVDQAVAMERLARFLKDKSLERSR